MLPSAGADDQQFHPGQIESQSVRVEKAFSFPGLAPSRWTFRGIPINSRRSRLALSPLQPGAVNNTMNTKRTIKHTLITSALLLAGAVVAAEAPKLDTPKDKFSYAIGMNIGHSMKAQGVDVNLDVLASGLRDSFSGNPTVLSDEEARAAIMAYQQEARAKAEATAKDAAAKNRAAGAAFLAENAKKEGVLAGYNGLQYKILKKGKGEVPVENHQVTVNYRGTLIDGTEFDSSYKRGQPATFPVTGVIKGWTQALLRMPVGSKWQLFIPADLAYGDRSPSAQIPPGSTLIFEVELLSTKGPEPVVSDIIKVPSAEEMKKGAKIETIKAEDLEKMKSEQK
jgi:FKBP-type peptidyl-prolyl cis-trans isomerase FklB